MRQFDPEALSSKLDWKQFESLAERVFQSFGYTTLRNYRAIRPRLEVDLLAERDGFAFVVDCKHWRKTVGNATMLCISERQVKRSLEVAHRLNLRRAIPLILTWRDESLEILGNGVPVVPIHKLQDFILNWESTSDRILSIDAGCL